MIFKKAEKNNLEDIMKIIGKARKEMGRMGIDQWQDGYPDEKTILRDIEKRESYIYEKDGKIAGTVVISFRREKDYDKIENGKWLTYDDKYCVIHRIAVNDKIKKQNIGTEILRNAEKICIENKIYSIKIDTHENNEPMKRLLMKNGFIYCGIIYLNRSNEKRIAFEKILKEK
ncbi:GNAT family N-acetyltransferase [Leptotrichia sp. OH3620_COT-345]|uniref:GNAT family N-acetyltransferase n=1 Tax=Leptotrichia sp. OH3620_COT-345 TaxID=2491048 RepID=UPI000F6531F4|nr:GNAT family N-acetyltransferase [Leptotrichia sp. OH3620_COT-345]RRD40254.1 GNAT family N-acetyltransferase [Leptotrichia sp. OH3620_COT-345]